VAFQVGILRKRGPAACHIAHKRFFTGVRSGVRNESGAGCEHGTASIFITLKRAINVMLQTKMLLQLFHATESEVAGRVFGAPELLATHDSLGDCHTRHVRTICLRNW
jgi:hypothetical protein